MKIPVASTVRSPIQAISRPQNGLTASRIRANTEITAPTSMLPTPNLRANTGSTGTSTPKPTATQKAIRPRTSTSRGREVRSRSRRRTAAVRGTAPVCRTDRDPKGFVTADTVETSPASRRKEGGPGGAGEEDPSEVELPGEQGRRRAGARRSDDLAEDAAARQAKPRRGLFEGEPPAEIPAEVRVTSTAAESDQAVPTALKVAAAWAWRIFLVAGLIYFVGWVLGFLSEVVIPLAVACLLAADAQAVGQPAARVGAAEGTGRGHLRCSAASCSSRER